MKTKKGTVNVKPEARVYIADFIQRFLELRCITPNRILTRGGDESVTAARRELLYKLSDMGLTGSHIAVAIGVHETLVSKYLRQRYTASHRAV